MGAVDCGVGKGGGDDNLDIEEQEVIFGGAILDTLGEAMFVMTCIGLTWIHTTLEENGVKTKVSYPFVRQY